MTALPCAPSSCAKVPCRVNCQPDIVMSLPRRSAPPRPPPLGLDWCRFRAPILCAYIKIIKSEHFLISFIFSITGIESLLGWKKPLKLFLDFCGTPKLSSESHNNDIYLGGCQVLMAGRGTFHFRLYKPTPLKWSVEWFVSRWTPYINWYISLTLVPTSTCACIFCYK